MKWYQRAALAIHAGYILFFFSEEVFWGRIRAGEHISDLVATWLVYSLVAYLILGLVQHYGVRTWQGLFLCGAIFGWLIEGVIVQTTYEDLPLSISFTALAWHALISVLFGWYLLPRALGHSERRVALRLTSAAGLFWGLWSISWWVEEPVSRASIPEYAAYAFGLTALLYLAYLAIPHFEPLRYQLGRGEWIVFILLAVGVFLINSLPWLPIPLFVLPPLIGISLYALARQRSPRQDNTILKYSSTPLSPLQALPLWLMPAVATGWYAIAYSLNLHLPTNIPIYLIVTPLGFILFGIALYRALCKQSATPTDSTSQS